MGLCGALAPEEVKVLITKVSSKVGLMHDAKSPTKREGTG